MACDPEPLAWPIRPVTRAEAPVWGALRAEMPQAHPTAFSSAYADLIPLSPEHVAARAPEPGGGDVMLGVCLDGALSGSAGFVRERGLKTRHKGAMWGVYLRSALRRRGVGEALVGAVIAHARAQVELLLSGVNAENPGARALYQWMGFRTYGVEPRGPRGDGRDYDEVLLVMDFGRPA
jgi:ribosomal protein S18 acetylase RimI-like enzyme